MLKRTVGVAPTLISSHGTPRLATPESCAKLVDDLKARGEAVLSGCHLKVER